ncbi:MAG: hypothetical protein KBB95_17185 [Deltaproteobacteria bacterium]|nr:hypothetical protein [Deltaproteobacteria bacterium]
MRTRSTPTHRCLLSALSLAGLLSLPAPPAHAGGVEATVAGARGVGRGGAMAASATGFDALRYNPARLHLGGEWNVGLDAQVHFIDVCFDRLDADGRTYPRVCNSAPPLVVPQLGVTVALGDRVGLGFGILPPPSGTSLFAFGDAEDGTILVDGQPVASPSRYANVVTDNTGLFPTVALSASLHPRVRMGFSFGAGVFMVNSISYTAGLPGAGPSFDTRTALSGRDLFVPRVGLALDVEPVDGLNVSWVTHYTADLDAKAALFLSGETGGGYSVRVNGVQVNQAFGWESAVAVRYAQPRFDLELDLIYQGHARTVRTTVDIPDDAVLPIDVSINGVALGALPDERYVERRWKNQFVLRVGGDVLVMPERLWLRGGFSFESDGNQRAYTSVENFLARRIGLHLGASVQVHPVLQVSLGYSRVFQPDVTVDPSEARVPQATASRPPPLDDPNRTVYVNGGSYRGGMHVLALGLTFQPANAAATPALETP